MKKKFKIGFLVLCVVVIISFIPTKGTKSNGTAPVVVETNKQDPAKLVADYRVTGIEDVSFSNVKRYVVNVVTKTLDEEQIKMIGMEVVEQLKKEKPFNAVSVFINDHEEFDGNGYALGKITYSPSGDWGKADEVSTGQYKTMEYEFDIKKQNPENQLTDVEANIVKQWYDTSYSMNDKSDEFVEDLIITNLVAQENNITSDQVDTILDKFITWMY